MRGMKRGFAVVAVSFAWGAFLLARQEAPAAAGRAVTMQMCASSCHGTERFASEHRSKSQWIETIETMKGEGAAGTDAEFKAVLGYLVAHAGIQVKINVATAKQIDDALDLEPGQAEAIVKYREKNGKFADWDALLKVPGLDPKKLNEQRENVVF
jgi:competence protein ComEA